MMKEVRLMLKSAGQEYSGASPANQREIATLGGGCFWCTEAVFNELEGVLEVEPGYSGGTKANQTYEEVCTGTTGHAEVVQITFDPRVNVQRNTGNLLCNSWSNNVKPSGQRCWNTIPLSHILPQ
jgi:hypothetical protein